MCFVVQQSASARNGRTSDIQNITGIVVDEIHPNVILKSRKGILGNGIHQFDGDVTETENDLHYTFPVRLASASLEKATSLILQCLITRLVTLVETSHESVTINIANTCQISQSMAQELYLLNTRSAVGVTIFISPPLMISTFNDLHATAFRH